MLLDLYKIRLRYTEARKLAENLPTTPSQMKLKINEELASSYRIQTQWRVSKKVSTTYTR